MPGSNHPNTIQDTYINADPPGQNFASETVLKTYTWPANTAANAIIIKWDLSGIPQSAAISDATLYLYMDSVEETGGDSLYDVSVHRIINVNPTISTCTWNAPWTSPGAQADISPADDSRSLDKAYGYRTWSVTNMVRQWASSPSSNYGMLLSPDTTASVNSNRYFSSSESPSQGQRPKLAITYSTGKTYHPADTDHSCTIEATELASYINRWKLNNADVTMSQMMDAVGKWKSGAGCI
jgi:hypothetical protein